jgi:NAD(P)-dependent dehydrogenase (short-subunit alcohol dehydrogenase family)
MVCVFQQNGYQVIGLDKQTADNVDYFLAVDLYEFVEKIEIRQQIFEKISTYIGTDKKLVALVNNAAEQRLDNTENISYTDWQATMHVNLTAPFLLIQGLLPHLIQANGAVVNIASIHYHLTKPRFVAYATSKAALVGLTKSLAVDLAGKIRVNCISPAAIETQMLQAGFPNPEDYKKLQAIHPVGRIGKAEEIAEITYFLCSEKARFIHGSNIEVDGGIGAVLKDL